MGSLARRGAKWLLGIVVTVVVTLAVAALSKLIWKSLTAAFGVTGSILLVGVAAVGLSFGSAAYFGRARPSWRLAFYRLSYMGKTGFYWTRERFHDGHPGNGKHNRLYPSVEEFEAEDPRRLLNPQWDFGVVWRAPKRRGGQRVTWIEATGELIAIEEGAAPGHQRVELLDVFAMRGEVDTLLVHWEFAGMSQASLSWVRRRAHGWPVPMSPGAFRWKITDEQPPPRLPTPPAPSVGRTGGCYTGHRAGDGCKVLVVEGMSQRELFHYVDASPTGFEWGYGGDGPSDLARSLLADRLGYPPAADISVEYCSAVVAKLPGDTFALTFVEVDAWIDDNTDLFAKHPRANPGRYYTDDG